VEKRREEEEVEKDEETRQFCGHFCVAIK